MNEATGHFEWHRSALVDMLEDPEPHGRYATRQPQARHVQEQPEHEPARPRVVLLTQAGGAEHLAASADNQLSGPLWILQREPDQR